MGNIEQLFSVWLLPEATATEQLNSVIHELSQRFSTPLFTAHLTLCSGAWNDSTLKLVECVDRIAEKTTEFLGYTAGLKQTDSAHQFFYIGVSANCLGSAVEQAQKELPFSKLPMVGPHVSLMYSSDFLNIERTALAATYSSKIPLKICFNKIALIIPKDNNWDDVTNWQMCHKAKLQHIVNRNEI